MARASSSSARRAGGAEVDRVNHDAFSHRCMMSSASGGIPQALGSDPTQCFHPQCRDPPLHHSTGTGRSALGGQDGGKVPERFLHERLVHPDAPLSAIDLPRAGRALRTGRSAPGRRGRTIASRRARPACTMSMPQFIGPPTTRQIRMRAAAGACGRGRPSRSSSVDVHPTGAPEPSASRSPSSSLELRLARRRLRSTARSRATRHRRRTDHDGGRVRQTTTRPCSYAHQHF